MRSHFICRSFCILGISILIITAFSLAADGPYRFLKKIDVGGEGGWDYLSVDSAGRRLYVTHQTKVVVIDIEKNERSLKVIK